LNNGCWNERKEKNVLLGAHTKAIDYPHKACNVPRHLNIPLVCTKAPYVSATYFFYCVLSIFIKRNGFFFRKVKHLLTQKFVCCAASSAYVCVLWDFSHTRFIMNLRNGRRNDRRDCDDNVERWSKIIFSIFLREIFDVEWKEAKVSCLETSRRHIHVQQVFYDHDVGRAIPL
jgi:hypothetical protein